MNSQVSKYISEHVTILKIIKFMRALMGFYNPTNSSKFLNWAFRAYCSIYLLTAFYWVLKFLQSVYWFHVTEFFLSILLCFYTGDEFFSKYCQITETHDRIIGNKLTVFDFRIKFIIVQTIAFRSLLTYLNLANNSTLNPLFFIVSFVITASRLNSLLITIIFVVLYIRMRYLRQRMDRNIAPVNIINKNGVVSKVREVRRCLLYYNSLIDSMAEIGRDLQCALSVIMIFNIPKFVIFIYVVTRDIVRGDYELIYTLIHILDVLEGLLLNTWPAIAAELAKKETENMKLGLSKQLVRCSDESLRFELQVALQYIQHRPFNFVLFYAIPLDMSVPVGIVSLCITYVIVAIQFKHFNVNT